MNIVYHPGKSDVFANALSRLSTGCTAYAEEEKRELAKDEHIIAHLEDRLMDSTGGGIVVTYGDESALVLEMIEKQN